MAKAAPPSTASAATPPASTAKGFRRGDGSGPGPPTGNRTTCNGTVGIGMTGGSAGFTGSVGYAAPTTSSAGSGSGSGSCTYGRMRSGSKSSWLNSATP